MEKYEIYKDIARRTGGDIYVGVVGPVRTGKSTFITRFMEEMVLPNIANKNLRSVATDEMPQSGSGKTITTTEPKFVPGEAVKIKIRDKVSAKVRLIDCVGYLVDGAMGHEEDQKPRLVTTPWSEKPLPFDKAAETGTRKVIEEHSTIGIVVTTDGSITEIPRTNYVKAEERVVKELKACGKPFAMVLNCIDPTSADSKKLASALEEKYGVPVCACNASKLNAAEIGEIMEKILFEFPLRSVEINLPKWMQVLPYEHEIIRETVQKVKEISLDTKKMRDFYKVEGVFDENDKFLPCNEVNVNLGEGAVSLYVEAQPDLFYKVLSAESGEEIADDFSLMRYVKSLSHARTTYQKLQTALSDATETGYGIVVPSGDELSLDRPELVKKGGHYGVRLKAKAPSLHMVRVDVEQEVSPLVGTKEQGDDMVRYLSEKYDTDPQSMWETNMLGKTLREMVWDGLSAKTTAMADEARGKMRKTLTRIVNEGRGGVICILL